MVIQYKALKIPENSPLRNSHSLFWGIRTNDEGAAKEDSFFSLSTSGKIKLAAPNRAMEYDGDGQSLLLRDGTELKADAVVLATGFGSSWTRIFTGKRATAALKCTAIDRPSTEKTTEELGIGRHPPSVDEREYFWNYTSLKDPPHSNTHSKLWAASIYRGIVPSQNIDRRDFAINGAVVRILHSVMNLLLHMLPSLRPIMDIASKLWLIGSLHIFLGTRCDFLPLPKRHSSMQRRIAHGCDSVILTHFSGSTSHTAVVCHSGREWAH